MVESRSKDPFSEIVIQSSVLEIFSVLNSQSTVEEKRTPPWVGRVREILNEHDHASLSLNEIATILNIHPVHLSRSFKKYFHCTMGEYVRKIRIEKAVLDLLNSNQSLTTIAHDRGFADQSHLIRIFKAYLGMNPSSYKKMHKMLI